MTTTLQRPARSRSPGRRRRSWLWWTAVIAPLIPAALWLARLVTAGLDPAVLSRFVGSSGTVAMVLLTLTLAATPIRIITGWSGGLPLRKPLGLYSFAYSALHLLFFAADHGYGIGATWQAIAGSAYLVIGLIALAVLVPLAATSNRWSMRTLKKNWKRLQRWAYVAGVFAAVHVILAGDGLLGGVMLVLLAVRLPPVRRSFGELRTWLRGQLTSHAGGI